MQDLVIRYELDCGCTKRQDKPLLTCSGSGESGKSTIVKQMKIIHQNGYTVDELSMYKHTVCKNLVDCAKALVSAMQQFEITPDNPANNDHCTFIMEYTLDPDPNSQISPKVADAVNGLWKDTAMAKVLDHSTEFYMMDSAP